MRRVLTFAIGEKLKKASSVIAALAATVLTGVVAATTVQPAASAATTAGRQPASFTVSSFNVLGSSHTPPGGKRAVGTTRIIWVNQLLEQHHVDVVGFQELQTDQVTKFLSITPRKWALFP